MTFTDSVTSTALGTVPLNSTCPTGSASNTVCASLTTAAGQLPPGSHTITATYSGDPNFLTSSGEAAITVISAIQTNPGQGIPPVSIHFNDIGAPGAVALQCSVQSASIQQPTLSFPKCSLDTNSLSSLPGTVNVTISTVAGTANAGVRNAPSPFGLGMPAIGILGMVLAGFSRRKRSPRKIKSVLGLMFVLSLLLFMLGCGGGSFKNPNGLQPPVAGSTQSGTYVVSVTGADSSGKAVAVAVVPLNVGI